MAVASHGDATRQEVEAARKRVGIYWNDVQGWERRSVLEAPASISVLSFCPPAEDGKSHAFTIISSDSLNDVDGNKSPRELLEGMYSHLTIESTKSVRLAGTDWTHAVIVNGKPARDPLRLTMHVYVTKVDSNLKMVTLTLVGPGQEQALASFEKAVESIKLAETAPTTRDSN